MVGKIYDFKKSVKNEHSEKYGYNEKYRLSVKANTEFIDQLNNKTKNVMINGYHVLHRARRREIGSKNRYKINKVNKLIITVEGKINKLIINTYLKLQIPMLCRMFFKNIAKNRDFVYNFCNNPYNKFHRYCCEWYLYKLFKNNTVMVGDDDVPNNLNQLKIFDIL